MTDLFVSSNFPSDFTEPVGERGELLCTIPGAIGAVGVKIPGASGEVGDLGRDWVSSVCTRAGGCSRGSGGSGGSVMVIERFGRFRRGSSGGASDLGQYIGNISKRLHGKVRVPLMQDYFKTLKFGRFLCASSTGVGLDTTSATKACVLAGASCFSTCHIPSEEPQNRKRVILN